MGKSKNKKKTKATVPEVLERIERDHPTSSAGTQAMDGHNVDGWTESQIAAYNELLIEREKLEKQRKDLEIKSAKSHAGRALLNENVTNIDSVFKLQKPTGDYQYNGSSSCCVELASVETCQHEICTRSRVDGVSYNELDTIKYYAMRIPAERTERRRDALRKQRDGELIKIKKEEDEDRAASVRKSAARHKLASSNLATTRGNHKAFPTFEQDVLAGATKETQRLVTNILEQLDDLRMDLQAGRISTTEMQKKLDCIDEEMQAAQLKPAKSPSIPTISTATPNLSHQDIMSSTKAFQDHIKDRIVNTKGDTYSKAFHIMEHFLSASKPGDFQAAVSELKNVLRLTGPMGDELQKSFDALEGIFDSPDRLSFNGPDGKQECSSIIDLMSKMKDTLQRTGQLPEGANSELVGVFEECIKLETDGKSEMMEEYKAHASQAVTTDLEVVLAKIKGDMVAKSPIPPLTEQKLGDEIVVTLDLHDVRNLMREVKAGATESQLDGILTTLVMSRAQKIPEKFVETIGRLALTYERLREGSESTNAHRELENAFLRVEAKMRAFVTKLAEKKATNEVVATPKVIANDIKPQIVRQFSNEVQSDGASEYRDNLPSDVHEVIQAAVEKFVKQEPTSYAHLKLRTYITEHGQMGLWPLWLAWSEDEPIDEDLDLQDKALEYEESTSLVMNDNSQGLKMAVIHLFEAGICPGMAAGVVSQLITDNVESNPEQAQAHMRELADCIQGLPAPVTQEWDGLFRHLALAMTQLYIALYANSLYLFPSISPLQFSISSMSMVVSYICLTRSKEGAIRNFQLMWTFVNTCMSENGMERSKEFYDVARHFHTFCESQKYRCLTLEPCSVHMTRAAKLETRIHLRHSSFGDRPKSTYQEDQNSVTRHANSLPSKTPALTLVEITNRDKETRRLKANLQSTIQYRKKLANTDLEVKSTHASRYPNISKQTSQMVEVTARKSLSLMQVGPDEWIASNSEAPYDVFRAMNDVLKLIGVEKIQLVNPQGDDATKAGRSKFSEHINELQLKDVVSAHSVRILQTHFSALESGNSRFEWSAELSTRIKDDALSGRWPNPLDRIRRITDKLNKLGNVPEALMNAINKTQADVEKIMQMPDAHQQLATKRFKFWLSTIGAQAPTRQAMYDLAIENNGTFEAYCALLASVRVERGYSIKDIRNLCSEVLELVGNSALYIHSNCISILTKIALQDWVNRGQNAPSNQTNDATDMSPSQAVSLNVDALSKSSSSVAVLVDAKAKLSGSSLPSSIASHAHTKPSLNTKVDFKSAVIKMTETRKESEGLAGEQAVGSDHDLAETDTNVNGASDEFTDSDELCQTEMFEQADAQRGYHGVHGINGNTKGKETTGSMRGQDEERIIITSHAKPGTITNIHSDFVARASDRQVDLVTRLSIFSISVNRMKKSDNEVRRKVNKAGGISVEEFKVFGRVTTSVEERLLISRDIASTIAETQSYEMVKAYLNQGYDMGYRVPFR